MYIIAAINPYPKTNDKNIKRLLKTLNQLDIFSAVVR